MREIRTALEAEVSEWPGVVSKEMMGCLCYFRGRRFFAFLVTDGIVLTKLGSEERSRLSKRPGAKPFEMSGRAASTWIQLPLKAPKDLRPLMQSIKESYKAAAE